MAKLNWADEHAIGVASDASEKIKQGLKDNFHGECYEVGMYLSMSRQADREGYPEIARILEKIAYEEAEHAARFGELIGELVVADTKKNLESMLKGENNACQYKKDIATWAKQDGYDAIHDTVHEMSKDEARHGRALEALLSRYFNTEIEIDDDPIICGCHKVRKSDIVEAIRDGADSVEKIADATNAGTACGGCKSKLAKIIEENK